MFQKFEFSKFGVKMAKSLLVTEINDFFVLRIYSFFIHIFIKKTFCRALNSVSKSMFILAVRSKVTEINEK